MMPLSAVKYSYVILVISQTKLIEIAISVYSTDKYNLNPAAITSRHYFQHQHFIP